MGINDYRLTGDTAELADLHQQHGYLHGRWTGGVARIGAHATPIGGNAGDCHYAIVEPANVPLRRQTVRGCRGLFTTPTLVGGHGPVGQVDGVLDILWRNGVLCLEGHLNIRVDTTLASLPIRQYQAVIGAACQGGSLFGGSGYTLTPVVTETGSLRCVILYRLRFDAGCVYQGVAMFEAHTRFRTQNMYTKDGVNC